MDEIIIRQVADSDMEAVEQIAVSAFSIHYDFYRQNMGEDLFYAIHKDWKEKKKMAVREACLGKNGYDAFVAETGGKVVGFVTLWCDPETRFGILGNNSVDPAFQGKGIGKRLYQVALDAMKEKGMKYARVDTGLGPTFAPARRAYEQSGFNRQLQTVIYYKELYEPGEE